MNETVAELQQTEQQCLEKFRSRAAKMVAANPGMNRKLAFTKAVEAMPKVLEVYMSTTQRLQFMGVRAAPLW